VARNCGWRAAQAPVVAFTDDDTQPAADWLQQGLAALVLHRDWVALAGQVKVPRAADEPAQRPMDHELMTRGLETAELVTANTFVWRDALDKVDGFDERFLRASLQAPGHVLAM
jgi:GT2 family glycosyltransferase